MIEDNASGKEREDDVMSALAKYLEANKEKAYSFATSNTRYNEQGRPTISQNDEWANENEWDELFNALAQKDK